MHHSAKFKHTHTHRNWSCLMWRMSKNSEKPLVMMPLSKKPSNLSTMFSSPLPTSAYCAYLLNKDFSPLNHHLSSGSEKSKRGCNIYAEEVSIGGGRWTPTPEQIHALDEIYRSGTRSPSATQIQQIASRLRRFGKIEGKNVFYWFQNHKARERQKRRRQQLHNDFSSSQQHLHGLRTGFEVGKAKKWVSPSDCSTISEESVVSLARTETEGEMDEKIQVADNSLQLKICTSNQQCTVKLPHVSDIYEADNAQKHKKLSMQYKDMKNVKDERKYQTLELFPDWNCNHVDHYQTSDVPKIDDNSEVGTIYNCSKFTPTQFFEFLPLTNQLK